MKKLHCFPFLVLSSVVLFLLAGCGGNILGKGGVNPAAHESYAGLPADKVLQTAETRFKAKKFDEALNAYQQFESMHPKSELMPYCIFGQGLCYFEQRASFDRDQTATRKALECFSRVADRYPDWKYTADAKRNIAECRKLLAEHELYIASFYQKTGRPKAALERFQKLKSEYPDHKAAEVMKGIESSQATLAKPPEQKGFIAGIFDAKW